MWYEKRKSFLALLLWYKDKKHEHYPYKKKKMTLSHIDQGIPKVRNVPKIVEA